MAPIHPGSWLGLPDLGITEYLGSLLGIPQNPGTGGTGLSNIIAGKANPTPAPSISSQPVLQSKPNFQSVLGLSTGPVSGGGVSAPVNSNVPNPVSAGTTAANLGFAAANSTADSYAKQGADTFKTLMDSVNAFRNRSLDLKNTGDQQIRNTSAGDLGSNATTASQLAGTVNRQGGNLGLGSKLRLGQDITGNLAKTQGNTIAARDTNLGNNLNLYNSRQDQANTNEQNANTYKQGIDNGVAQIRSGGLSDYTGALANIVSQAQQLAALSPLNSTGLSGYSPDFSGITNTLNGIMGSTPGATGGSSPTDATNLVNSPTIQDYLKKFLNPLG